MFKYFLYGVKVKEEEYEQEMKKQQEEEGNGVNPPLLDNFVSIDQRFDQ